ncbi:hypothetical protein COD19_10870 [Bacillus cereus]|uniref:DUF3955 domain-containing protein n=1 Tax=Bacillus cereus TaxID=1396 RepID=A0A2C1LWK2_BACCE|nr:hypothetical protein COD19_10870 [Bacillus cereus]
MKKIIVASVPLILGVILMIASAFAPSTVQEDGMLYDPYFFLVPVSVLFIFIGVIALMITAITMIKKITKNDNSRGEIIYEKNVFCCRTTRIRDYFINRIKVCTCHCTGKWCSRRAVLLLNASRWATYFRQCRGINYHGCFKRKTKYHKKINANRQAGFSSRLSIFYSYKC